MSNEPASLRQTKRRMLRAKRDWFIPFLDFVDDLRRHPNVALLEEDFQLDHPRFDALLASSAEALCCELHLKAPSWIQDVPALKEPWFPLGIENLKAITIVESPVFFRRRKIFVLENFLRRV
jgi:hypothetical protein